MSYVDLIIKYLSGDLSSDESRAFEKELESDAELKAAFEGYAAAYRLTRHQLQKRDEEAFESKLTEAMSTRKRRAWWYIPPAVASILAIVLIIFSGHPGNDKLLSRFHLPAKDPLILGYFQDTRGKNEQGIMQYREGNYQLAMDLLSERISAEEDNKLILLYYLLSSMELDCQQEVLELIQLEAVNGQDLLDQSISWYTTLALIKSDRREDALRVLHPLSQLEGPYRTEAIKLEKLLLK
jgi:hypothetical protein